MKQLYEFGASAQGGRNGTTQLQDGSLSIDLAMPSADNSGADDGHNPEQLFAMGYAACFDGALNLIAKKAGENIDSTTKVYCSLNEVEDGFAIGVRIEVEVSGVDQAKADKLVEKAHTFCPYSRAVKGNVDVSVNAKAI